jgi:alcohol dehydrogenase (cytochrome c)
LRIWKPVFVIPAAVVVIAAIGAAVLYFFMDYWTSLAGLPAYSRARIRAAVSCRAGLYVQKAEGEIPEVSWTELWRLTSPGGGFQCAEGGGVEAGLSFSSAATDEDRKAGARIFSERCTGCHGSDGSGGPHAPALTRPTYNHGDSDFAIYKVLRDGIPGTAMPSAGLPVHELLQVMAHVKMLQAHVSAANVPEASRPAIVVSGERLQAVGSRTDEWLMYSGAYNGWRYTPLTQITPANVARLRPVWIKQLDSDDPYLEATPLVVDGEIFLTSDASHVVALDAENGDLAWEYRRPVPADLVSIYGHVNRGLAVYGSTIFFGSLDGDLVAINADTGKLMWQVPVASRSDGYSITGAPLVVNHAVIVGISGGEFRTRGFLAAYDVASGRELWRFDTIPGPGEAGHETWENDAWRTGGGGTWITGSYDPATDLLYWGVGNPSPAFSGDVRPGDNLYTDSVIALHASTGKLAWYFQFTPHDEHDRDSAQTPVLADLPIKGVVRKVICWPNRNGFHYVLDRVTGEFLAGVPFVEVDWATGLTPAGRPILSDAAHVTTTGRSARPGIEGGTNWQNPAFDPASGTIFVAATESRSVFTKLPPDRIAAGEGGIYLGGGWSQVVPATHEVLALDAATGRRKWEYTSPRDADYSGKDKPLNYGGLLVTAGGLVFGTSGGAVFAVDADTGRELWRLSLGGNTKAPPISFTIDGRQVIAVAAGRALFLFGL